MFLLLSLPPFCQEDHQSVFFLPVSLPVHQFPCPPHLGPHLRTICAPHQGPPRSFPSHSGPGADTGIFARSHKNLGVMKAQTSWMHLYWQDFWTILVLWSLISATIPKMSTYWEQVLSWQSPKNDFILCTLWFLSGFESKSWKKLLVVEVWLRFHLSNA